MKQFMILYVADGSAEQHFDAMQPEAIEAMTAAWNDWAQKAGAALVDFGNPTMAVGDTQPGIGGYSFLQAESLEELNTVLVGHPHTAMGGKIDIYEVIPAPGM